MEEILPVTTLQGGVGVERFAICPRGLTLPSIAIGRHNWQNSFHPQSYFAVAHDLGEVDLLAPLSGASLDGQVVQGLRDDAPAT